MRNFSMVWKCSWIIGKMSATVLCCRGKILAHLQAVKYFQNTLFLTATNKKLAGGKVSPLPAQKKINFEPETDANKLCNYLCGGNINQDGSDPELLPPEEYPDWLWELRTQRGAVNFEDLEMGSEECWKRARKISLKEANKASKIQHLQKRKRVR